MLSENIKRLRKANNISQDELAEKLNVSRQSISLWENGQTQPTIENLMMLSKIFDVSIDALLYDEQEPQIKPEPQAEEEISPLNHKKRTWLPIGVIVVCLAVIVGLFFIIFSPKNTDASEKTEDVPSETTDKNSQTTPSPAPSETENPTAAVPATPAPQDDDFDLFEYWKQLSIEIGALNGDSSIYQQPASDYGGYEGEYFSVAYWADSDMVEFCLHCPLDETLSINFYLRMRGGFNGQYEYLSSRYYRSDGTPIRTLSGYIDPSVFSAEYPLGWDDYIGNTDGQTEFIEESRVGICDLIQLIKAFTVAEELDCDFSAFGFVNF